VSEMPSRRAETEGHRGSRIDTDEGGRYVGIPLNGQCSVQETGCGTDGGFTVLELPSRDEAIAWAARIAKACRCDQELRVFGFDPQS
jgi:hypothetical protein